MARAIEVLVNGGQEPYSYQLEHVSGSVVQAFQDSPVFEGLAPGNYTVRVRDANGCSDEIEGLTIDVLETLSISATVVNGPEMCDNMARTFEVSANGDQEPYSYQLEHASGSVVHAFQDRPAF